MYVEEIVTRRKGKEYKTFLVRESFRNGASVGHRTIANISNLPRGCVDEIKRYLNGKSKDIDLTQIKIRESKEYGASQSFLCLAKKMNLDSLLCSKPVQWRENALAMIVGNLIYTGPAHDLVHRFSDTVLWESCGHLPYNKPSVSHDIINSLEKLADQQRAIQKKLAEKHLEEEGLIFAYRATTSVKLKQEENELSSHEKMGDDIQWHHVNILVYANSLGCPVAIEPVMDTRNSEESTGRPKRRNSLPFKTDRLIFIGKDPNDSIQENQLRIDQISKQTAKELIEKKILPFDSYTQPGIHEIKDPIHPGYRYIAVVEKEEEAGDSKNFLLLHTKVAKETLPATEIATAFQRKFSIKKIF